MAQSPDTKEVSTMCHRICFENSLRYIGTLLRCNNCIIPLTLTSIRSHGHLFSHMLSSCRSFHCVNDMQINRRGCLISVITFRLYFVKIVMYTILQNRSYVFFTQQKHPAGLLEQADDESLPQASALLCMWLVNQDKLLRR